MYTSSTHHDVLNSSILTESKERRQPVYHCFDSNFLQKARTREKEIRTDMGRGAYVQEGVDEDMTDNVTATAAKPH